MSTLIVAISMAALLGSAIVGGVFFAFSSFVMKALGELPASQGIASMQSINVVVINRSFIGIFLGTAVLAMGMVILTLLLPADPSNYYFLTASICYLLGAFLVTMLGNVPLNQRLASVSEIDGEARGLWAHYLHRWTQWNHIRTAFALLATLLYATGLVLTP